ncbi:hypothetical protein [Mesorhizobium sp. WSM3879]|uniref:hypothetical protein n=1 Tax=Mesorhizobium sp. WSM3879 TaxID=2029406 RepID=UPI00117E4C4B|nr:hypothetical protein [Mesorhizobium sp. WSM3879]
MTGDRVPLGVVHHDWATAWAARAEIEAKRQAGHKSTSRTPVVVWIDRQKRGEQVRESRQTAGLWELPATSQEMAGNSTFKPPMKGRYSTVVPQ